MRKLFTVQIICFLSLVAICFVATTAGQVPGTAADSAPKTSGDSSEKIYRAGMDGVSMPACYYMPKPPYSKKAKAAKYHGVVIVEGTVMLNGKITKMRMLKTPGMGLDDSVLKTLKKRKCTPAIGPSGRPVPTLVTFEINFRLY